MRKKLVLKIGDKYYFSEVGGFFKLKIYGISEANSVTDKLQKIIDFEIMENKAYPIKDHIYTKINFLFKKWTKCIKLETLFNTQIFHHLSYLFRYGSIGKNYFIMSWWKLEDKK